MLSVEDVLAAVPEYDRFPSVDALQALASRLASDSRFEVEVAGTSEGGVPIHHIRFGSGAAKALFVAYPHCMEPIGGLTVDTLLTLLEQSHPALLSADVEWHFVPCIDPDGARLNEGWSQKPFSFKSYMEGYYVQEPARQVDMTFPVSYEKMHWSAMSREAAILKRVLDTVRPDFYYSLHNTRMGGAFFYISQDVGPKYYQQTYAMLSKLGVPVLKQAMWKEIFTCFSDGFLEQVSVAKFYDYMKRATNRPEDLPIFTSGRHSVDYYAEINPRALSFTAETGYVLHPDFESDEPAGGNLRHFMLRVEAGGRYLASALLQEWESLKGELDRDDPLYKSVESGWVLLQRDSFTDGGFPVYRFPTRDIAFNPAFDRLMTKADRFKAAMVDGGLHYYLYAYQLVRLLRKTTGSRAAQQAAERLDTVFAELIGELEQLIDFSRFSTMSCRRLAQVQIGSGLIMLNAVLDQKPATAAA